MSPLPVLRRKAGARPGPPPPPRGMSPEKALVQALTKSGEGLPGLELTVREQDSTRVDQSELLSQLPEVALFTLADGPGDSRGLICFSPELVDALIEVQTMGRVDQTTRAARETTRIDAALTRDFVETVLTDFATRVVTVADARWARGFKYGTYVPDPTPLPLMLGEGDYRLQCVTVELGNGAKRAKVWLALPAIAAAVQPSLTVAAPTTGATPSKAPVSAPDPVWAADMQAAVSDAPVELRVTLTRFSVPLSRLQSLKPGDTLPISRGALGALEVMGAGPGHSLSGKLGQQNGMRAVRLSLAGPAGGADQPAGSNAVFDTSTPIAAAPALAPLTSAPDMPDIGAPPELPDLPPLLPEAGNMPPLPDSPPLDGPDGGLPDLPPLPALPDLPAIE
ncbi:FliM/FliN family flagellar motor switch protein [Thalassobacter stenotrophicus]|uniref:FliM/FliN family flagellar motor switch protein n=1 Tax=Thalassobacter stenotrophicus TaxID=266809 RepID=UPI0022A8EE2F|nr:FliM/FliN family flagellar motor switch protein [Thalassobacter stenotrophicus]UYP66779.1 FliM/FliN family flagellar motor switch protein [Thalassobacter stenotrophicus]